jgi:hypothetical protein
VSDRRIDRPLLLERRSNHRSPDSWCPHLARLVSMTMPVSTARWRPGQYPVVSRMLASGVDTAWVPRQSPRHGSLCGAQPNPGLGRVLPPARPPQVSMVGVRPPWPPQPCVPEQERSSRTRCRTLAQWPFGCHPGSGHCGRTVASGVGPADAVLQEPLAGPAATGGM